MLTPLGLVLFPTPDAGISLVLREFRKLPTSLKNPGP